MYFKNQLKYTYYIMRHGQSKANVEKIIVGSLANGILSKYGLTPEGVRQCEVSIKKFMTTCLKKQPFVVVHSPFSRAKETAIEIIKYIPCSEILEIEGLKERGFGDLELMNSSNYYKFWLEDRINPDSHIFGSESPNEVLARSCGVIEKLEKKQYPAGQRIFLVSHGDTLQILQTAFLGLPASRHNTDVNYLANAEIVRLN